MAKSRPVVMTTQRSKNVPPPVKGTAGRAFFRPEKLAVSKPPASSAPTHGAGKGRARVEKYGRSTRGHRKSRTPHPLAEEFEDSLTLSSDAIRQDTHAQLSENHQIALSHTAAATAQSAVYRAEQLQARKLFADMEIVSPEYARKLAAAEALLRRKNEILDGLWNQWQSLTDGIQGLCDEGRAVRPEIASDVMAEESGEEEAVAVEGHMEGVYESLIELKEKWVKKMEDSEKNLDADLAKKRRVAAVVIME